MEKEESQNVRGKGTSVAAVEGVQPRRDPRSRQTYDDAATSIDGVSSEAERSTAGKASALLLAICKHSLLSLFRYTHERMSFYVADLSRHIVTLYADGLLGVSQSRKILLGFRGSLDIRRT